MCVTVARGLVTTFRSSPFSSTRILTRPIRRRVSGPWAKGFWYRRTLSWQLSHRFIIPNRFGQFRRWGWVTSWRGINLLIETKVTQSKWKLTRFSTTRRRTWRWSNSRRQSSSPTSSGRLVSRSPTATTSTSCSRISASDRSIKCRQMLLSNLR